jgi:hypothetical protein
MHRTLVPLALLLAAPPALAGEAHPAVDPDGNADACQSCHETATPAIVKQWEGGTHGLVLVKCFVCHGSTGKDFVLRAKPGRCEGCHPAEVASTAPAKSAKSAKAADCFGCHAPHTLAAPAGAGSPHAAR